MVSTTLTNTRDSPWILSDSMPVHRRGVSGPRVQMTSRWKALVETSLRDRGWGRADLARELGVSAMAASGSRTVPFDCLMNDGLLYSELLGHARRCLAGVDEIGDDVDRDPSAGHCQAAER